MLKKYLVCFGLSYFLMGCSDQLSRSEVENIAEEKTADLKTLVTVINVPKFSDSYPQQIKRLVDDGYISIEGSGRNKTITIHDKGERYIFKNFPEYDKDVVLWSVLGQLTELRAGEIEIISDYKNTAKYNLDFKLNQFGKIYFNKDEITYTQKLDFRKTDEGWKPIDKKLMNHMDENVYGFGEQLAHEKDIEPYILANLLKKGVNKSDVVELVEKVEKVMQGVEPHKYNSYRYRSLAFGLACIGRFDEGLDVLMNKLQPIQVEEGNQQYVLETIDKYKSLYEGQKEREDDDLLCRW